MNHTFKVQWEEKDKQLGPALPQIYSGAGNQHDGSKSQGALAHQYRRKGQQYGSF